MRFVGRRVLALALAACVPIGAVCEPLVHAHADDHHDPHHQGGRIHAHLGGHASGHYQARQTHADADHHVAAPGDHHHETGTEVEAGCQAEDTAVRVHFFVAVDSHAVVVPGLQQDGYRIPPPLESVMGRPPVDVHSHGPPDSSPSASRAPPAHLS
jgi:hypothetical protein